MASVVGRNVGPDMDEANHKAMPPSTSPQYKFDFADFLLKEYRFGIDPRRPFCKAFREGHCPLGKSCPDKHPITRSTTSNQICKHWLRGLCKKGHDCEFIHEYNLRRMPDCAHFARTLYCPNGDECLYPHVDPATKLLVPCPHYDKGFCPLGPHCSKKHIRKTLCRYYLTGFCPEGSKCKDAHPRWPEKLPKPKPMVHKTAEEIAQQKAKAMEEAEKEEEREWDRRDGGRREGRGRGRGGRYGGQRRRGPY